MKKIFAILLTLVMVIGMFAGCGGGHDHDPTTEPTEVITDPTGEVITDPTIDETEAPVETEVPETEAPTEAPTEPEDEDCVHNYKSETVKPTCTSAGYTKKTCTKCGYSFKTDAVKATGHDYKSTVIAPTQSAQGYTLYECKNCDYEYKSDYTAKLPSDEETKPVHQHSYKSKVTKPTCTAKGYTTYTCDCGSSYKGDEKPATGHDYSSKVTLEPTCTSKGTKTYTCKNCSHSYHEDIAKKSHDYKSTVIAPTCTAKGYTLHECKNCDASYKDAETKATGHSYTTKNVKTATCTEDGVSRYTCANDGCTYSYDQTVEARGHKWGNWVVTKEPTTSAEGVETRTCTRTGCGATETRKIDKLPAETQPPHSHSYSSKVTKAATCTENGVKTFTCSCGSSYTETINATGHSYSSKVTAPTCDKGGYTTYTCACGDSYKGNETAALGHKWGDWKVTKEPTTEAEGQETRTCSTCGATETRAVEKLPEETEPPVADCTSHSWGNWTSDDNGSYGSCTNCGQPITIDKSGSNFSKEVVTIINEYRAAEGLDPVAWFEWNILLVRAHELTVCYSHNRPNGSYGYDTCIAGGYSSARAVVDGWINSNSHRGSLMNPNATEASAAYNGSFWVLYIG